VRKGKYKGGAWRGPGGGQIQREPVSALQDALKTYDNLWEGENKVILIQ
jgi:hypothetical protein